jgi:hypothetical protein
MRFFAMGCFSLPLVRLTEDMFGHDEGPSVSDGLGRSLRASHCARRSLLAWAVTTFQS